MLLVVYADDFKMAGPLETLAKAVAMTCAKIRMEAPDPHGDAWRCIAGPRIGAVGLRQLRESV